ncbi:MAG TPA: amidohydrolase family protein [Burkholderiales bacterium]|nr:amidohydrolase family protein [Burkholderiales bacterium]
MSDFVIRGAAVLDGTGAPGVVRDVAVSGGRILRADGGARKVIDAGGLALMPGIVDLHTHYDAQVTWDPKLTPSVALGVTTAVLGNCGFGIAPCPPEHRETMLKNLSVVEGMDLDALLAGTRWEFETFAEYLDALERIRPYANVGVLAGHSCIRTAAMGDNASLKSVPSAEEMERMQALLRDALRAGAVGFASSFSPNHSGWGGRPMPSTICADAELKSMVQELKRHGRGVFVVAAGSRATPEYLEEIVADTGRPAFMVTVLTMHNRAAPGKAMQFFERCQRAIERGREVYIHANCQPLSFDFNLRDPYVLYSHDAFDRVKAVSPEERGVLYKDESFRRRLRENFLHPAQGILFYGDWSQVEEDGVPVTELAKRTGKDPLEYVFDLPLDTQLVAKLYQNDDAQVAPLLKHPAGVIALSDAGAHLIYFCDAGYGLHFLSHWVRETGTFTLEEAVRRLTSDPARKYRIPGRGTIAPGNHADLLLFDPQEVGVSALQRVRDMPGGGQRMIRHPRGVHGVWVNGVRVFDGNDYAELPGPGAVLREFGV